MQKTVRTALLAIGLAAVLAGCAGNNDGTLKIVQRDITKPTLEEMGTITLPDLASIEVKNYNFGEVTEDEVNEYISYMSQGNYTEVDRPAQDGDIVNIDFAGKIDGEAFPGGTAEGYDLKLGSGEFLEDFEVALVGAKAGEQIDIEVKFPDDYFSEEVAGKTAVFDTTVNKVQEENELTDEFVQTLSKTASTVDEYRNEVRDFLKDYYTQQELYQKENEAMDKLVQEGTFEPSEKLIEYLTQKNVNDLCEYLKTSSQELDAYLESSGTTLEELSGSIKKNAENAAPYEMVIAKIKNDAGIELNDETIEAFMKIAKTVYGPETSKEQLILENGQDWFDATVIEQAVYKYIADHVSVSSEQQEEWAAEMKEETITAPETEPVTPAAETGSNEIIETEQPSIEFREEETEAE